MPFSSPARSCSGDTKGPMPNIKSAIKRMRQNTKRRAANRTARSAMRTAVKRVRGDIEENKLEAVESQLSQTLSVVDKAARKKLMHKNKAARHSSRLMKAMNAMK